MVNKRFVPEPRVHRNGLVVTEHIIRVVRDDGTIGQHIAGCVRDAFGERAMIVAKDDDVARRQRSYQPRSEDVAPPVDRRFHGRAGNIPQVKQLVEKHIYKKERTDTQPHRFLRTAHAISF